MAHPETEAEQNNIPEERNEPEETFAPKPHATRSLTVEEAADELAELFDELPSEQEINRQNTQADAAMAEELKHLKLDEDGNAYYDDSAEPITNDDEDDLNDPDDQEYEYDEHSGTEESLAIPAPVSWSNEHKEVFDALPPEAKEIIVERERERDKGLQAKTTEIAEERRQLQSQLREIAEERSMYADHFIQKIDNAIVPPDVSLMDESSPAYNPAKFHEDKMSYESLIAQREIMQQTKAKYEHLAAEQARIEEIDLIKTNHNTLSQHIPDWSDDNHRHALLKFGGRYGFKPNEIQSASPAEVILLHKAMKYDELTAQTPDVRNRVKKAPKVQKPGAKSRGNAANQSLIAAKKKLKQTGSVEDAAAVLAHIL